MAKRVLIADDETAIADLLKAQLEKHGLECDTVNSGDAAIAEIEAGDYDLLLLDMVMPDVNGICVIKTLKGDAIDIPIVIISNLVSDADKKEALEAGADDYFIKIDLPIETLCTRIGELTKPSLQHSHHD